MKYCTKCKKLYFSSDAEACTKCGRDLISDPNHHSPVDIVTANGFELERIKSALTEAEIPFTVQECENDTGIQILNSAPPENCRVFIPLGFYTQASELLMGIGALKETEELSREDEERLLEERMKNEEEMSPKQRFWVKLLSLIIFIALLAGVILLADLIGRLINPAFYQ